MMRKVNIQSNQKVTTEDFNNLGDHPRESMDAIVKDVAGFPTPRYSGMAVEQLSLSTVRVNTGRFFKPDGSIYTFDFEGGQTIDFLAFLPAVAKRIATVVAFGNTVDTDIQPRTFLLDATTRDTEGREVATENRRAAFVGEVYGTESPTPLPPAIQSDYVAVAQVTLGPGGIESIQQLTGNRVASVFGNTQDIATINTRLNAVGPQIDTLRTDISALGTKMTDKADFGFVNNLALDVARVKDVIGLPDDYATYAADRYLTLDESDTAHPAFAARVMEGVRFPSAGSVLLPIALENPIDPKVIVTDNMALPRWTPIIRTRVEGRDSEYALANTTVETEELREVRETRIVRRMLGSQRFCTNASWWQSGQYDPATGIFRRAGETFVITATADVPPDRDGPNGLNGIIPVGWFFAHRYVEETVINTHWDRVSVVTNLTGSVAAQTILNSQDGYLSGVDLFFTRKANAGDVRVLICDVNKNGRPMLNRVLAQTNLTPAQLNIHPTATQVTFKPVFMPKGSRFAIVVMSTGAHFVAQVNGNKFGQGAVWYKIDGNWLQGDPQADFAFRLRFAQFESPITTVQLGALELAGGIDSIEINADASLPDGTRIDFEVRIGGIWYPLSAAATNFNITQTLPALVQFRAVFVGTTDLMPALGLGALRSEVTLTRPANTLVHVSTPRLMPAPVNEVQVILRLENWDAAQHSAVASLLTGAGYATTVNPTATTMQAAPDDPFAVIKRFTFIVSSLTAFKIRIDGNIGGSGERFHVAERLDIEF
jgi:hypothetical protein